MVYFNFICHLRPIIEIVRQSIHDISNIYKKYVGLFTTSVNTRRPRTRWRHCSETIFSAINSLLFVLDRKE